MSKEIIKAEKVSVNHDQKERNNELPYYLVVCACTYGLAHTYLVEERVKQYAELHNFNIKVETHGVRGDLNIINDEDLKAAMGVIIAVDKDLDLTHIVHQNIVKVRTTDVLKNPDAVFDKLNNHKKENKIISFLKLDLFKHLNFVSQKTFSLYFILGALVGLSLYIVSFPNQADNRFFNTIITAAQYVAILAPSVLLALFLYRLIAKNLVLTLAIFTVSSALSEYNYVNYSLSSYGLLGLLSCLLISVVLINSLTWLNKKLLLKKAKKSIWFDNLYYSFKFLINLVTPLILFLVLFYSYETFSNLNKEFYDWIANINQNWWFRSVIAFIFLLGIAWDSGGVINKWSLMISGFLFYDSFAYSTDHIWMTPITATALGIVIPCGASWVRGKILWRLISLEEKQATKQAGISFMRSISEGFLYFRKKYSWKTLLAHVLTSLYIGILIGLMNIQFFGGMNNIFSLIFSFSKDDIFFLPNLGYFIVLISGCIGGGIIHTFCYWPTKIKIKKDQKANSKKDRKENENEKMKDSLHTSNSLR